MNKTSSAIVRTLLLGTSCLTVLSVGVAKADPTGGTVVTGAATIASHGNSTTINQSTNRALINWDSFSISAGGQVRFNQPNAGSITLNRVLGGAPSSIYGKLLANGQVWLINSNGILFGKGAQVNVGGLLATTSDIADRDFANGNFNFSGGSGASVVNQGTIRTRNGGSAVLSGASVDNQGLIQADAGTVVLGGASAFTVDFDGDNLLRYAIAAPAGKADNGQTGVSNSGTISANSGGRVIMTVRAAADIAGAVINNSGIVTATSAKVQNGEVVFDGGDGDVNVGGMINATGAGSGQTGGFVSVTGRNVTVADNTKIDISGDSGGGSVRIGGDVHGAGPVANAANTTVGSATIKADATHRGNGGSLVVWSNGLTDFSGIFSAIGGAAGGDGGFIETSGHHLNVGDGAKVDTTAARGQTGNWLLDPDSIAIANNGTDTQGESDTIAPATIVAGLVTTNITLEADNNITVYDDVNYNSAHTLSLLAGGDIYIAANVQNAGTGAINVIAGWNGATTDPAHFTDNGVYGNHGGSVYVTSDYDLDPDDGIDGESDEDEVRPVAIGSAGGTTTIAGAGVEVLGYYASSQIGYTGGGGGDIVVRATDHVLLDGSYGYDAIIGNGGFAPTSAVTGNIDVRTTGTLGLFRGDGDELVWIGNLAGGDAGATGNVTLVGPTGDGDFYIGQMIAADLAGGDFTLGVSDDDIFLPGLLYNSTHTLNLLAADDILIFGSVQNSGSGAINLVAGWDGITLDPAHFGDNGVYGNNEGFIGIGGPDAEGDVSVGSAHGSLNIYTGDMVALAAYGNVQVGYHGAGGGDINILATGDVALSAQDNEDGTYSVMIGNGALDGSVGGAITGNIFVKAEGTLSLDVYTGPGCGCDDQLPPGGRSGGSDLDFPRLLGIGNASGDGEPAATGDVTLIATEFDDSDRDDFGKIIGADLSYGNVTLGSLNSEDPLQFDNSGTYDSAFDFTLLSVGDIAITGNMANTGTGAITLIAGWDGVYDKAHLTDTGHYGLNDGTITIGGEDAEGDASIGTAQGALSLYGANLVIDSLNGAAQLGYQGGGGGDIVVRATGDVTLDGSNGYDAIIGNGGNSANGDVTGNIDLRIGGTLGFYSGDSGALVWIGNLAGGDFGETGNVTLVAGSGDGDFDFGHVVVADLAGGDFTLGLSESDLDLPGLIYNSAHTLNLLAGGNLYVSNTVQNSGSGAINLVAGWDGVTLDPAHFGDGGVYGNNEGFIGIGGPDAEGDVAVGSAQGSLNIFTQDMELLAAYGNVQVGYHGAGGGDINVLATGDVVLSAQDNENGTYSAMIGNGALDGSVGGAITGNIFVKAGGTLSLDVYTGEGCGCDGELPPDGRSGGSNQASSRLLGIGNASGDGEPAATGDVTMLSGAVDEGVPGIMADIIGADLGYGNVTVGNLYSGKPLKLDGDFEYNSSFALSLLSTGDISVTGKVQNAGSGAINAVSGWDGTTLDPAHFGDNGVYGHGGGSIVIGGTAAAANAAIGSQGGATSLYAAHVTLTATHGYAQAGYHGNGVGAVNVTAASGVSLSTGGNNLMALIGNGGTDVTGNIGGAVTVTSFGAVLLTASNQGSIAAIGNVGAAGASESGDVTVDTHGNALTLTSSGVVSHAHIGNWTKGNTTGTSSGNIAIDAGAVTLAATANGSYSQIGNGAFRFGYDSGALSGNIVIHATTFLASAVANSQARVGNLGTGVVTGDLSLITTGNVTLNGIGNSSLVNIGNVSGPFDSDGNPLQGQASGALLVQSGGTLALTAQDGGNARIETGGATSGTVTVSAVGDIMLSAGTPSSTGSGAFAYIGSLFAGNGGANISVTSLNGGVYLTASEAGGTARIGNQQNGDFGGTLSGSVSVTASNSANGNVSLSAAGANALTAIGNVGFDNETVGGDITVIAGKTVTYGTGDVLIGNDNSNPQGDGSVPAPFGGNVAISAWSIAGDSGSLFSHDLTGGDVTVGIIDPNAQIVLSHAFLYNSSHNLSFLGAGSIEILASLQNSGSGGINIVAGWDGHTLDAAHFFDPGHYGNHQGAVTIGGASASGNVAIGSNGGATNIGGASITLAAVNGYAQVGYNGSAGGAIGLHALGNITLTSGAGAPDWAQIGNGLVFGTNAAGGDVSVTAGSIQGNANTAVTGANLSLTATSGIIGASDAALRIAATSLAVSTFGGNVYLTSPNGGVSFGGSGVNTGGGSFALSAAGAISQTAAFHTGQANLSTTSGDITLTNADNGFGALTIVTPGNATLRHSSLLTIASAHVTGTLSLTAGGSINQSGAIVAGALNASAGVSAPGQTGQQNLPTAGSVVLTNTGNSFATLSVHSSNANDATIFDSGAVVLAGAVVGGKFTLTAGGAIGQTGAILAGSSSITTTVGDITLTNSGNAFGPLTVVTPGNASLTAASLLTIASANIGGALALTAGSIGQSGAIVAASLSATSGTGGIVLGNTANSFATLAVHTGGASDATVTDSTAVVVAASSVGGKFTLNAGGAISQSGAIAATQLAFTAAAGNIALTNTANAVTGMVQFSTPGSLTFYDTSGVGVGALTVGGDLTLLSKGNVTFKNSFQTTNGNIVVVAGWDGTTVNPASFGNAGVFGNNTGSTTGNIVIGGTGASGVVFVGSKNGTTSLFANNLGVIGIVGAAQLGYHGTGGGAIRVRTLHDVTVGANAFSAMIGNGSLTGDVTGNVTGDIDLRVGGNINFNNNPGQQAWLGNVAHSGTETGNLLLVANDENSSGDSQLSTYIVAALAGGDVTLGFTGTGDQGPGNPISYNSSHTLNVMTVGNFVVASTVQNSGSGAINLVGGWDGVTLNAASFGNAGVYGNGGKGVVIGGSNASGNASLGSASGTTSIYGASLALSAVHGYAQLGFNGHGSGAIFVKTTGGVSLTGGASDGQFAQIGNGGRGTSGNNSGDITINAGGDLVLTAGAGNEAYVQVGHGGAESNAGANGYSNIAPITITAANVLMTAGSGTGAYGMIGNGGYKSGLGIAGGTATNGGTITVTSGHAVSLTGGSGTDASVQIGNGGNQSNLNAAASAGGTDSGDVIVHAPNGAAGSVTLTAGSGANASAQIGNGGYAANSGPSSVAANWTITGNVFVTDLALSGGNGGPNAFALIGNGDASHHSYGNVNGDVVINANGQITYTPGSAAGSQATIGNFTGQGTVSGTLNGASPPPEVNTNPVVIGVVVNNTAGNNSPTDHVNTITTIQTIVIQEQAQGAISAATIENSAPGPLASLEGKDGDGKNASDDATVVIADSLDGAKKAGSTTILSGMLKATPASGTAMHAIPPADQDFSSWGNEALWQ